ncbi:MAG: hypothetical protein A2669_01295 [Candidatus Yanofskybacteria bacterium RIFCSPHIGHO2_01_FULL_48_25b]|uniref:methylated-DNA--[protein]-cysteine S-methyltransferase n=1 Tax=Candidatus Yanofskybacteria bacterium RIFCSPHIGHO2_01_FULL_48_25b TaxID=1802672 RepID=A0A1F8EYN6_9BACT|nr:MAG: hypothetical protein A2669_01295 [Candidatus Yanofskybacteria bacterium RIFCSPHIGHO2_01_FULL_48_25b]
MVTEFQKMVYDFVKTIPKGKTISYKDVAIGIGKPNAARAVGNALNRNPYAPKVPCHRVIRSNGKIGGFASGSHKKLQLLRKEEVKAFANPSHLRLGLQRNNKLSKDNLIRDNRDSRHRGLI